MTEKLLYEQNGHVVTLTLNQPESRNPITDVDFVDAFVSACEQIKQDLSVRCVIITGAGKGFSSGGNLNHMRDKEGTFGGDATTVADNYRRGIQRIPLALWELEVPVIAAVNGAAYGAGFDLTLMADIRIASEKAVFAENFVKVGIIPGDGGAWLLQRQIGLARAAEMTFTGDPIDAQKALDWGLVTRVVPHDALIEEANLLAERIAKNPPKQLRMSKRLIRDAMLTRLDSLLNLSASFQGACHQTEDHMEAVSALLEKREPAFHGK